MAETFLRKATNEITDEQFPIRAATQVCRQKLQECASQASLQEGHWAENCSSDFNLWDSGVGACANELNCLDKRLERDTSARKVVIGALSTLAAWTTKCRQLAEGLEPTTGCRSTSTNEQSTGPADSISLDEAKNTVEGLLKVLVDLEIAIRRAGTASRVRRADRTFSKRRHRYQELSEHLEFILRVSGAPRWNRIPDNMLIEPAPDQSGALQQSHASAKQRSAPAKTYEIDVESALHQLWGEKTPLSPEQQVLLVANLKRTDRFLFYKVRQEQLRSEGAERPSQVVRVQVRSSRDQPSTPPVKSEEQFGQSIQPLTNEHAAPAQSQHSTGTTNKASDYAPASSLETAIKVTSPGVAATTIALRADYPKPPKDKTKCPYCLIPFKGEADDMRQWKKHASEDLQPYTCYLPDCPQHHPFFNTFHAWKAHVLSNDHQQFEGWTCFFCQYSSKPNEDSIFLEHVQNCHSNAIAKESLTNYANMCRRHTAPALNRCPVCSTDETDWKLRRDSDVTFEPSVESFLEHIGQCLHHFALRVLPETEPVEVGDGSGQNPTNGTPIEHRSWPSCSLHVSHHPDGLTETDLEISPGLTHHDKVDDSQRLRTWVELAENMYDPNSPSETMRLETIKNVSIVTNLTEGLGMVASGEVDLDDEDFLIDSSPSSTLEDRLFRKFVVSSFDYRRQPYLPEGQIVELVTAETIREELELDFLDARTASKFDKPRETQLVDWILNGARKLFAICVECSIRPRLNMLATFMRFKKYSFDDMSLPIRDPRYNPRPTASNSPDHIFNQKVWSELKLDNFYEQQWKYLAPVFGSNQYDYDLPSDCILPFQTDRGATREGAFSSVYKVKVHPNHMKIEQFEKVAVKEMKSTRGADTMNNNESWEREARALRTIGTIKSGHIVNCIAAVRRGDSRYFIFPWADGGNLRDLWEATPRQIPQKPIIEEAVIQLRGIADALDKLHNLNTGDTYHEDHHENLPSIQVDASYEMLQAEGKYFEDAEPRESIRHGDLKPENILRFTSGTSKIGELRIADMGLAKRHVAATQTRTGLSSTRYGTVLYEAPEAVILDQPRSRLYDIWSMGCIILEFIIWMLYGNDELRSFYHDLQPDSYQTSQYFDVQNIDGSKYATVHPVVQSWIDYIRNVDPECSQNSAIRDLLDVVRQKLLVVQLPPGRPSAMTIAQSRHTLSPRSHGEEMTGCRATARQFRDSLDTILEKVRSPAYLLTGNSRENLQPPSIARAHNLAIEDPLKRRPLLDFAAVDFATEPYKHTSIILRSSMRRPVRSTSMPNQDLTDLRGILHAKPLDNWEFPVDNKFASSVFEMLDLRQHHPQSVPAKLCERCSALNFWAGGFDLEDRLVNLEASGLYCDFCRMLRFICTRHEVDHFAKVRFERSQSNLVLAYPKRVLVLSILRSYELETPLHIQLGFPELPAAGSDASFRIMRAWLDDCGANHNCCQFDAAPYPTRLIDVGTSESPKLQLVVPQTDFNRYEWEYESAQEKRWIALSHPWGNPAKMEMFWTGKHNIDSFRQEIPFEQLPATFRDAVITTRALQVRHLWIDAICIIHGENGDFNEEAKHMEDVFNGAYCVIAASRATSQADGFLGPRPQREYLTFQRGSEEPFYICEPIDNFNQDVLEGSLNRRGWILQERALARRTIFFTDTQTYFECGNGVRCETLVKMHNNMADFLGDPNFPNKTLSRSRGMIILHIQDLFRKYSRLEFSHVIDRPVALAGLEHRLKKALGVGGSYGVFDDGPGGGLFHRGLLWQRGEDVQSLTRIVFPLYRNMRVPSWSWMAYEGGIDYLDLPFDSAEWETTEIQPPKSLNDHLAIDSDSQNAGLGLPAVVRDFSVVGRGIDEVKLIYDIQKRGSPDEQRPQCIIVAKSKKETTLREKTYHVLIVATLPASGGARGENMYERVGVGRMLGKYIALDQPGTRAIVC